MAASTKRPVLLSAPGLLFLIGFMLVPLLMAGALSFQVYEQGVGPTSDYTFANYLQIVTDSYYLRIFGRTLFLALTVSVICVVIGAPEAYFLHRMRPKWKAFCLVIVLGPLMISVVVRTLGWALMLGRNGVVNDVLLWLGIVDFPIRMLYSMTAVVIGSVHVLVPFMVIAVWASLQRLDPRVTLAAASLGATPSVTFRGVILPAIIPGILSGSLIVFALSASSFATPAILGGRQIKVFTTAIYDEFLIKLNWPVGAALAVCLFIVNVVATSSYNRILERRFGRHTNES